MNRLILGIVSTLLGFGLATVVACTPGSRIIGPPMTIAGAEYVGRDICAECHPRTVAEFTTAFHSNIALIGDDHETGPYGCEGCHGPGSLHVDAGGGYGRDILNPKKNPEPCFACHTGIKVFFLMLYRHPVLEGRLSCSDCHDPHGEDIYLPAGKSLGLENGECAQCHREQSKPWVFEHEALRDGCQVCHQPHGSINDKMLTENDNNLCFKCHAQLSDPGLLDLGDAPHAGRLATGPCWSAECHTAVHGSNINAHLRY